MTVMKNIQEGSSMCCSPNVQGYRQLECIIEKQLCRKATYRTQKVAIDCALYLMRGDFPLLSLYDASSKDCNCQAVFRLSLLEQKPE